MNNSTDLSSCDTPYEGELSLGNYLFPVFFSIIFIVGAIGNITVIYIIFFKPGMRTVPNLLIVNLSLGDIVFIFGHMTFSIPSYVLDSFYGGIMLCRLMVFVKLSTLGVSIFTLTFMAIDRFRAITKPLHQQALNKISVIAVMVIIWIISMTASLPSTIMTRVENIVISYNSSCSLIRFCRSDYRYFELSVWIRFCFYFVGPFLVISFCYIGISLTLCKSQNVPSIVFGNNVAIPRRQMEARKKLSIVVLALVVIFVVCRLPNESHSIFLLLRSESIQIWVSTATVLLYLYSSINPLILCILSPTFRRFMLRIWCRCFVNITNNVQNNSLPVNSTKVIYNRVSREPSPFEAPV